MKNLEDFENIRYVKIFAKVALRKEYEFVAMVEESGKFIEDSIAVAQKYFEDNQDLIPVFGFVFSEFNPNNGQSTVIFDCNEKFEYFGI